MSDTVSNGTAPPNAAPGESHALILLVEDEPAIADLQQMYLVRAGFRVRVVTDGIAALNAVRTLRPAAILLDIGIGRLDGIEVCRALRAAGDHTPVLFVTARDDEIDRVLGLELGADDYVTKPFSPRELVARVRAVLRRPVVAQSEDVLVLGPVRVDCERRRVWTGNVEVRLTFTEFDLLVHLMRRPGRVFERDQLLSAVWGYSTTGGTRTVDVHIAQIRAKLGPSSPIRTVRGVGYAADET